MKRIVAIALALGLIWAAAGPVLGQPGDALVSYVTEVSANLMQQDSATFEGLSTVILDMDMGGAAQHIEVSADITGEYAFAEGDFAAWYTVMDQTFAMQVPGAGQMAFDMTVESLMAEATLYERYTSDSPMFASAMPSGWTIVDDAAGTPGAMGDPTSMLPGIDITKLPYIIGQRTVAAVTEHPPEIIDGREMRVFAVDLDMEAVSHQMSAWMSGLPNDEIGADDAALVAGMMPDLLSEMEMTWTVWIDSAAGLPYRSAGSMVGPLTISMPGMPAGQGMGGVMDLALEFDMTFTAFNVPVTIEAPELGS